MHDKSKRQSNIKKKDFIIQKTKLNLVEISVALIVWKNRIFVLLITTKIRLINIYIKKKPDIFILVTSTIKYEKNNFLLSI